MPKDSYKNDESTTLLGNANNPYPVFVGGELTSVIIEGIAYRLEDLHSLGMGILLKTDYDNNKVYALIIFSPDVRLGVNITISNSRPHQLVLQMTSGPHES